jgi:aryl-alcohol dehydrogenase-like predicted oxidoreductase
VNFIDTADVYSVWFDGNPGGVAETIIGNWIKKSNIPRDSLILATKVRGRMGPGPNDEGLSRAHILDSVDGSLRRLGTDYIDLYQAHWYDDDTRIDETLSAFDHLVQQGKVRYLGCSNYPAWRLTRAILTAEIMSLHRYESLQPHYSLVKRAEFERELADVCREYGIGVIPYSPLAGGFLTGKYRPGKIYDGARTKGVKKYFTDRNWALLNLMDSIKVELEFSSISQIALAWLLSDPIITSPIIGPRTLEQLADNLGALEFNLSDDTKGRLDEASSWDSD